MDDTRELKLERRDKSVARTREEESRRQSLDGTCQARRRSGSEPRAIAAAALDGILDALDFERGFIFLVTPPADSLEDGLDRSALRPLAARSRREGVGAADRSDVRNPEFAVNHSVVKRALAG